MSSNFEYLTKHADFEDIAAAAMEAERSMAVSNATAALLCRRALEVAVKWMYRYDSGLTVPYQENLSALIHEYTFKNMLPQALHTRIRFIITLGNKAAHTTRQMRRASEPTSTSE